MFAQNLQRLRLTEGERSFSFALFAVALCGAGLAFVVVNQLGGGTEIIRPLSPYDVWSIFAGAVGAACGLYLTRHCFGNAGVRGLGRMCGGIVGVSFAGSIIGGTLALPLYGTMFGPFSLLVTMVGAPILAVFWVCTLVSAHMLLAIWRRERDSIFEDEDDEDGVYA